MRAVKRRLTYAEYNSIKEPIQDWAAERGVFDAHVEEEEDWVFVKGLDEKRPKHLVKKKSKKTGARK